jgi:hypothetical protein
MNDVPTLPGTSKSTDHRRSRTGRSWHPAGYFCMPPETEISSPVTNDEASLAR